MLILKGKYIGKVVTVSEVMQGQGGPKHEVIIVEENDIPESEERYFETNEVGPTCILKDYDSEQQSKHQL